MPIRLVTGGVKSGKSQFAESLCHSRSTDVIYIATGSPSDEEMKERIARHRQERPGEWGLVEEPFRLAEAIAKTPKEAVLIIDSLTTWVSNQMMRASSRETWTNEERTHFSKQMKEETERLIQAFQHRKGIIVTDEVGLGGVSMHPLGRLFQDTLGQVNQQVAQAADEVWFVVSGIPWRVKG